MLMDGELHKSNTMNKRVLHITDNRSLVKIFPNRNLDHYILINSEYESHTFLRRRKSNGSVIWEKLLGNNWVRITDDVWEDRHKRLMRQNQ